MTQYIRYPASGGSGGGVSSLDSLVGDLTLVAGTNITITDNGIDQITISATTDPVSFTAVGAVPNANGAIVTGSSQITLEPANASFPGVLLAADWNTFNNKQNALTFSAPLVNTANTISIPQANGATDGFLDSADWIRFDAAATATTTGTSNSFAGFDSSGDLESIPGWLFDNLSNGANVSLSYDPNVASLTLNSFYSAFNPTADNGNDFTSFSISGDYDAPSAGFSSNNWDHLLLSQIHRGDGDLAQMRGFYMSQSVGNGTNTPTVSNLNTFSVVASIETGSAVSIGNLATFQMTNNGSLNGNYGLLNLNFNGNPLGSDFTGINLANQADVANNQNVYNSNITGATGNDLSLYSGSNSGAVNSNLSVINTNNSGTIGGSYNGLILNNGNTASVVGAFAGLNINNQATVGQFFNGSLLINSGVITKGLSGYAVNNSGNIGDGTGTNLTAVDANFNTGSVNGNISGLNLSNSMSVIGTNNIYGTNVFNTGNGYRFTGAAIGNSSNQTEEIRGIQFNSTGDSRTATIYDCNFSGNVTDDATGVRINFSGSTANQLTGLNINLNGATDNNPQGVVGISSDSRVQINASTQLRAAQGFQIGNRLESLMSVPIGSPVTGTDALGNNFAGDFLVQDDVAVGGFGIGWNSCGFVASLAVANTKTVDKISIFLAAAALPDPGFTTGGHIDEFNVIASYSPIPQGGTVTIDNAYVYKFDPVFGNLGSLATNAWGVWIGDTTVDNWFAKDVVIGGSTGKPVGSEKLTVNGSIASVGSVSGIFNQSAADTTTSYSVKWPASQGSANEVLTNDGSGNLSWATPAVAPDLDYQIATVTGITQPGGNATYIQAGLTITTPNISGSLWKIEGFLAFYDTGASVNYAQTSGTWASVDGNNTGTQPTLITPTAGLNTEYTTTQAGATASWRSNIMNPNSIILGPNITVYLVPYASWVVGNFVLVDGQILATRVL